MTLKYRLSEEAQNDLRKIRRYTQKNWGRHQVKQYLIELTAKFIQLANAPKLGRTRGEIAEDIRSIQASHHIVFYRERRGGIEIARVLHPSMDFKRRFKQV